MIVYMIVNKVNLKKYIGITSKTLKIRWKGHIADSTRDDSRPICRAIKKYGSDNFHISEIDTAPSYTVLYKLEKYYINYYKTNISEIGYNATEGGNGNFGFKHTEESKRKMSEAQKGKKVSDETKQKISEAKKEYFKHNPSPMKGHKASIESRKKMSESRKGLRPSAATRKKMSESRKGRKHTEETKRKISESQSRGKRSKETIELMKQNITTSIPVIQLTHTGRMIREFISLSEVERVMGITRKSIKDSIECGSYKLAGGYLWKFKKTLTEDDYKKLLKESII